MIVRPQAILLDAQALSALAEGERRMQAWATVARRTDSFRSTVRPVRPRRRFADLGGVCVEHEEHARREADAALLIGGRGRA